MASGMRFVKRAVQADLARFKAYVEMEDARGIEYRPKSDDADEPTTRGRKSDGERKSDREQRAADRNNRRSSARS
jgi:hypothetical protein